MSAMLCRHRSFKKMHSNEDLDCKNFADQLGDRVDTGTACRVRLGFSYITADDSLQITQLCMLYKGNSGRICMV